MPCPRTEHSDHSHGSNNPIHSHYRTLKLLDMYVNVIFCHYSEQVDCEEPIVVVSHKIGVCRVSRDGKPCKTVFTRVSYDGKSSIVKCKFLYDSCFLIYSKWTRYQLLRSVNICMMNSCKE